MSIKTSIKDGFGTNSEAKVTNRGQLVTAPLEFSDPSSTVMDIINIPYTLVTPKTSQRFVITELIFNGNKNVGTAGAEVLLYETDTVDGLVSTKDILTLNIGRLSNLTLTGINWVTSEGRWLIATTDDDDIYVTIAGYYISA